MAEPAIYESNALVENRLNECVARIENKLDVDVLAFSGPFYSGADLFIRDAIEWRKQQKPKRKKLAFFLETNGGYIEISQRINPLIMR